jgi:hypothetical protein
MSHGVPAMTKKLATRPTLKPASLKMIVIVWFGRYHIPWAK